MYVSHYIFKYWLEIEHGVKPRDEHQIGEIMREMYFNRDELENILMKFQELNNNRFAYICLNAILYFNLGYNV